MFLICSVQKSLTDKDLVLLPFVRSFVQLGSIFDCGIHLSLPNLWFSVKPLHMRAPNVATESGGEWKCWGSWWQNWTVSFSCHVRCRKHNFMTHCIAATMAFDLFCTMRKHPISFVTCHFSTCCPGFLSLFAIPLPFECKERWRKPKNRMICCEKSQLFLFSYPLHLPLGC